MPVSAASVIDAFRRGGYDRWVVATLAVAALLTRAVGLDAGDLLVDEYFTYNEADQRASSAANFAYYWLTVQAYALFGHTEWAARFFAMVFGVLAPPVLYLLWREIVGRPAALSAGLFTLTSSWHLYYSQAARYYSAVFLLSGVALALLYRATRRDSLSLLAWGAGAAVLGMMFHLTVVGLLGCFGLYALLVLGVPKFGPATGGHRVLKAFLVLGVLVVGALSPVMVEELGNFSGKQQSWGLPAPTLVLQIGKYFQLPIVVAAVFGVVTMLRQRLPIGPFFAIGTVVPVAMVIALSMSFEARPDYLFYSAPLIYAAAGYGCTNLLSHRGPFGTFAVTTIVLVSMAPEFVSHYTGRRSLRVSQVIAAVEERAGPLDRVVELVSGFAHYSEGRFPMERRPGDPSSSRPKATARRPDRSWEDAFAPMLAKPGRLWIVLPVSRAMVHPNLRRWLSENAQ